MIGLRDVFNWVWTGERRTMTKDSFDAWASELIGGSTATASGVSVTTESAMRLSAVHACVRIISEDIASLPLHVFERIASSADGRPRKRRAFDHPASRLLHDEPNQIMSAFTFREVLGASVLLWGNAYAAIYRNGAGEPLELIPVAAPRVRVRRSKSIGLVYDCRMDDGSVITIGQADMIHVPGLSFDGITGLSVVRYAAQSIGLGIAAEQYGAAFFGNGAALSGYISLAGRIGQAQALQLREQWQAAYGGLKNAHRTAVLPDGGKFERISIPPNEAQFIETRKFQTTEIARWFRVPPHMIGDLERATFSNIEHQSTAFVTHTLRPWLVRFESEWNRKLFPSSTDGSPSRFYATHVVNGLMRGDVKTRGDYYVRGRQWGWLSANDVRELEDMEPIEDGDVYLTPLNMVPAGTEQPGADPNEDGAAKKEDEGASA